MKVFALESGPRPRRFALAFETDDAVIGTLEAFADAHGVGAAFFTAIGAFRHATLGYFDWGSKEYLEIGVDEQVEVVSLTGNITRAHHRPAVHIHCVLGRPDGTTIGGHLLAARVRPTLELHLERAESPIEKHPDPVTGLDLLVPEAGPET